MPVAFVSREHGDAYAPVARLPFRLGADPSVDLVDPAPGVAPRHAALRCPKGEYIVMAADGAVFVNDREVPMMALRDGDTVRLGPHGRAWRFRNRMQDAFHPPGTSLARAWAGHPRFGDVSVGPGRWGPGRGIGGRDAARCARVAREGADDLVVKRLGAPRASEDGDRFLRLLARIGGARGPGLACLADGGLAPVDGVPHRWMATTWVEGTSARDRIASGGVSAPEAVAILRSVARGLARLHRRGLVHRDVAPGNVIVAADGRGVLIDYGQSFAVDDGAPASRGVVGTPGYVAPEEVLAGGAAVTQAVDVYGLAAVGYALLTGAPPADGDDVLDVLARAGAPPVRPSTYGIELPAALETVLLEALAPDPGARPTADAFLRALEFARTQLGLGGVAP